MPVAEVNGQSINYADSGGDGTALLFSHGFLMDHTMFDQQLDALAGEHRCVAWDERGFGATPATGPFSFWDSGAWRVGAYAPPLGLEFSVLGALRSTYSLNSSPTMPSHCSTTSASTMPCSSA